MFHNRRHKIAYSKQGDHSTCSKPPVDFKTSLSWPGQAETKLLFCSQREVLNKWNGQPVQSQTSPEVLPFVTLRLGIWTVWPVPYKTNWVQLDVPSKTYWVIDCQNWNTLCDAADAQKVWNSVSKLNVYLSESDCPKMPLVRKGLRRGQLGSLSLLATWNK